MANYVPTAFGWHRDLPDPRDYSVTHEAVRPLLADLCRTRGFGRDRPAAVNWEEYLPPAAEQGGLGCCTACACAGLVEYFERLAHGRAVGGSRRFLYRMARRLLHWPGDAGATLRSTLKALRRFGLPPHEHWPDAAGGGDEEPAAFLFSFASEYRPLVYLRLDPPGEGGRAALDRVKSFLAAGLPLAFGFTVFDSVTDGPDVPFPSCFDRPLGGQAVVAVGYDDARRVRSERGALRLSNSWGPGWGDGGLGWLPYRYVGDRLAADFWAVLRPDWLGSGEFGPLA